MAHGRLRICLEREDAGGGAARVALNVLAAICLSVLSATVGRPAAAAPDEPFGLEAEDGATGGTLRMLGRGGRDARTLVVFGYARLVGYRPDGSLAPDIAKSVETLDGGRRFVITLRKGHRWSDGHPFTTEDFRFWWQDVANHPAVGRGRLPPALLVDGAGPHVSFTDDRRIEYAWDEPNPEFLPALAGASPVFIYRPAHYLKTVHADYADADALAGQVLRAGLKPRGDGAEWVALFHAKDRMYRFDNIDLPTLQPWRSTVTPPADRYVAVRNPHFHRVDSAGVQLPYIDRIVLSRAPAGLIPAKTAAGESDLQAVGLSFKDAAFLKDNEKPGGYGVRFWPVGRGAQIALYPNLNVSDRSLRALMRDARFRRALSLAIDREEINRVLFLGLAEQGADTLLPDSPLYRESYRRAYADHDPDRADRLLDEIGLTRPDRDEPRRLPDGSPLVLVVATGDADPSETDALQLAAANLERVGVKLAIRAFGRGAFRDKVRSGAVPLSTFYGMANALAGPDWSPSGLAPTDPRQNNWPAFALNISSGGRKGQPIDMPDVRQLSDLLAQWRRATTLEGRRNAWRGMLEIHADRVFSIGLVGAVPQPVVVSDRLRGVPVEARYGWAPFAYFGAYRPDLFWIEE